MVRSSLALALAVLCSTAAAASDLASVYVAPGGIYAPSANVYVPPAPAPRPYVERGYYDRSYGPSPAYRAPAAVYGDYGPGYAPRPAYVERAPVYSERYYAEDYSYAPRPPLPVPYRARPRCDDGYGGWSYCD